MSYDQDSDTIVLTGGGANTYDSAEDAVSDAEDQGEDEVPWPLRDLKLYDGTRIALLQQPMFRMVADGGLCSKEQLDDLIDALHKQCTSVRTYRTASRYGLTRVTLVFTTDTYIAMCSYAHRFHKGKSYKSQGQMFWYPMDIPVAARTSLTGSLADYLDTESGYVANDECYIYYAFDRDGVVSVKDFGKLKKRVYAPWLPEYVEMA